MTSVIEPDSALGRRNVEVEVHVGTRAVRALSVPLAARTDSGTAPIRYKLKGKAPLRFGDRFLVRTRGQTHTLGGGIVLDPDPVRQHAKGLDVLAQRGEATPESFLAGEFLKGPVVSIEALRRKTSFPKERIDALKTKPASESGLHWSGAWVCPSDRLDAAREWLVGKVEAFHAAEPSSPGMDLPGLDWGGDVDEEIRSEAVRTLEKDGTIRVASNRVSLASHRIALAETEEGPAREILDKLAAKPLFPETKHALGIGGQDAERVLDFLVRSGQVVALAGGRYMRTEDFERARETVLETIRKRGSITLREARDKFGASRAAVQSVLDAMDAAGLTSFDGEKRTLVPGR